MKKNVYSLVLMEDVVAQIDQLAYQMNTSRSNLINQILAEYVSYTTPEKRMRQVFDQTIRMLTDSGAFQLLMQPSDSTLAFRSALAYKYNPTVRYSVELYRRQEAAAGELKVTLRSQNNSLILYFLQFFKLWSQMEHLYADGAAFQLESGRYIRLLRLPDGVGSEQLGEIIADYIQALDDCMKLFFHYLDQPQLAAQKMEARYRQYRLAGTPVI